MVKDKKGDGKRQISANVVTESLGIRLAWSLKLDLILLLFFLEPVNQKSLNEYKDVIFSSF